MKIKKILIGFISVAVLMSTMMGTMMTVSAAGGKKVEFSISEASVKAGQTVVVEVSAKGAGIAGIQGKLAYDSEALTLEKAEGTDELDPNAILTFREDQKTKKFINGQFAYVTSAGKDMNGVILKYTFKAADTANGTYAFALEGLMVFDDQAKEISSETVKAGSLTVTGGKKSENPASEASPESGVSQPPTSPAGDNTTMIIFIIAGVLVAGLIVILIMGARKKGKRGR